MGDIKIVIPLLALILSCLVLIVVTVFTYRLRSIRKMQYSETEMDRTDWIQGCFYAAIVCTVISIIASIYWMYRDTPYAGHIMEWLNIIVRVMHVTFGIAWIGASFYFVFLENALNRTENVRDELAGNLWAVHGGGFYYLEKYKIAPREIPKHLHWFKYEAYFTWLSGIGMLFIIYYFNSSATLIDTNVLKLSATEAILISLSSFIAAWCMYDLLCKSRLRKKPVAFAIAGIMILIAFAWFYSHVFSGRAAFIHFGAMLGSIMVGNVFFVIIPSQKAMVKAAKEGLKPDGQKGKNALFRSIHNNYFTLPVLFVMVSNHFPSTFGNKYQWLILSIISIGVAGIKHWLNLREKGKLSVWVMPASVLLLIVAAYVTAPRVSTAACEEVSISEVNAIIQRRCIQCHSSTPTDDVYTTAPNGVKYDTPQEILQKKELILQRVVITKTMPQNNKTNMTPEERELIRCWAR